MNALRMLAALVVSSSLSAVAFGCGGSQKQMVASDRVPAAKGKIETDEGDNGNTQLTVRVEHLAEPAKIDENATTYVVWIKPPGAQKEQNIGALAVDKNLTGTLKTTTPHDEFELSITAEPFPNASTPSGPEVLSTTVREDD